MTLQILGKISAALAFVLCIAGGIAVINSVIGGNENHLWMGLGLYFIGKAFFVGPSLLISATTVK